MTGRLTERDMAQRQSDEDDVRRLYETLLEHWNARDAARMAALFEPDGTVVGFDGSLLMGQSGIQSELATIFSDHPTGTYVAKVRQIRFPIQDVAIIEAVAGMVPPDQNDLNPAINAVQALVAVRARTRWQITHFQNTPAAFHGRPELSKQLTRELRELIPTRR